MAKQDISHSIIKGLFMGGSIFFMDILLKPMFSTRSMTTELLKFILEGSVTYIVYDLMTYKKAAFGNAITFDGSFIVNSIIGGLFLLISDIVLGIENFRGLGSETVKFFIQGILLVWVYTPLADDS